MKRKKRKNDPTSKYLDEMTTQSAGTWINLKESLPPYFRIISVKNKTGAIFNDCARIPDGETDCYIQGLGNIITDLIEWEVPQRPVN